MTVQLSQDLQKAKQIATTAQVFAVITLIAIGIHIAVKAGLPIGNALFSSDTPWRTEVRGIGLILVSLLPAFLFFEAVNQLRHALVLYRDGNFFSDGASGRVAQAGDYAVGAMIATIFVVPNLTLWISKHGGFDMRWESEVIGMLAFGLFVSAVGRVLTAATQIKAENESFV